MTLRLLSYLAPSLPYELFEELARHVGAATGRPVELGFDSTRSGPRPGEHEPFDTAQVDLAYVCATSYVWLTGVQPAPIELVGAAWVPTDPRARGRAVYFGDVLTTVGGPRSLSELAGLRIAYNDEVSLSGHHSLRGALLAASVDPAAVELRHSGSHLRSLEMLDSGEVDAAAIDSNVWRRRRREDVDLGQRLVTIAALGPHPVQPLVARAGLPARLRRQVRAAMLAAHEHPEVAGALRSAELSRFVPVDDGAFTALRVEMTEWSGHRTGSDDTPLISAGPVDG